MIFKAIGGALETMSVQGTTIRSNRGDVYTIDDKKEKRDQILRNNQIEIQNTANWYELFRRSFSDGVLRKNTIFPGESVNGYVYYPLGKVIGTNGWGNFGTEINELNFQLVIRINDVIKVIKLNPTSIW